MITKMKKYTFLVFHRDYETFLEQLRTLGVVHVTEKASGQADDKQLQELLQKADSLRKTIANGAPDQLLQERTNLEQRIAATQKEASRMQVWGDFSQQRMQQLRDAGYQLRFYTCSKKQYQAEWGIEITTIGSLTYFVQVLKEGETVELPDVCQEQTLNEKSSADLQKDVEALNGLLVAQNTRIDLWAKQNIPVLQQQLNETLQQIDWQRVHINTDTLAEGSLKLLEGFCPVDKVEALNTLLEQQHIYYQAEDPTEEDNTPIKLHNNRFTKMFECLTGMYGWPTYGEFDPTPILAPFFLLFFALCMGDAGYGILLIIIGQLIAHDKLKIQMFEGLGPIITALGVGTMVVGFFLGTFFGISLPDASWVPQGLKDVMITGQVEVLGTKYEIQMLLALAIGVFHICLAMTVKALCFTKRYGFKQTASTWGWLLLIVGGIVIAVLMLTHLFSAEVAEWAFIIVGTISALGIFIFNTPGRNPLINIGAGLWDTYGMVTGVLSDVLSYIRLYALGLAGGMLGAAFNDLAMSLTGSIGGWIGCVLILILGHILNLALSSLGAFVHPLRLSFVEYFKNCGYEGKGTLYQPFTNKK